MSDRADEGVPRRDFNKAALGASAMALGGAAYAGGSATLKAAWIGTGSRGGMDVQRFLKGCEGVKLVAMADVLRDKLNSARKKLENNGDLNDKVDVGDDDCYVGFDAYKKVMARDDVDIVIHTTPPGFRPMHVMAAVEAGKHVFCEKPGATDPVGIRTMMAADKKARQKSLSIIVGTQQRRVPHYLELIKRVKDGAIGNIVAADVAWHWGNAKWHFHERKPDWSDMEWQIRCWPYFTWLSGDHVVEQHLHNVDVVNWVLGTPKNCHARGGRIARTGEKFGNIYDHFSGVFDYGGEVKAYSGASQIAGGTGTVRERIMGTKGALWINRGGGRITGENAYEYDGPHRDGTTKQFQDLCSAIRNDEPVVEAARLAESTAIAMTERMAAYTGQQLSYDWVVNSSKEELVWPESKHRWGDLPVRDVRVPGETKLV